MPLWYKNPQNWGDSVAKPLKQNILREEFRLSFEVKLNVKYKSSMGLTVEKKIQIICPDLALIFSPESPSLPYYSDSLPLKGNGSQACRLTVSGNASEHCSSSPYGI